MWSIFFFLSVSKNYHPHCNTAMKGVHQSISSERINPKTDECNSENPKNPHFNSTEIWRNLTPLATAPPAGQIYT